MAVSPLMLAFSRLMSESLASCKGDVLEGLHQARVHFAHAAALRPVEDVRLGGAHEALLDQDALHDVLNLLHGGDAGNGLVVFHGGYHQLRQMVGGFLAFAAAAG